MSSHFDLRPLYPPPRSAHSFYSSFIKRQREREREEVCEREREREFRDKNKKKNSSLSSSKVAITKMDADVGFTGSLYKPTFNWITKEKRTQETHKNLCQLLIREFVLGEFICSFFIIPSFVQTDLRAQWR